MPMTWSDRVALGLLELLFIAIVLLVAISSFSSAFSITTDRAYGWFVAGAILIIIPLWLVLRIAERRANRQR